MATKKRPAYEEEFDGVKVRVYSLRSEFQALVGDGDLDDPKAEVWVFPKMGTPDSWAHQAYLNHQSQSDASR